jgi:hypothetical protein
MQRNLRKGRKVDKKDKEEYNRLSKEFFKNVKPPPPPKSKKPSPPPKNKKNK